MNTKFEYRVCQFQDGRIVFVNGVWQGSLPMSSRTEGLTSCPLIWDYLEAAGWDGWELVAVAGQTILNEGALSLISNNLFLKKEM